MKGLRRSYLLSCLRCHKMFWYLFYLGSAWHSFWNRIKDLLEILIPNHPVQIMKFFKRIFNSLTFGWIPSCWFDCLGSECQNNLSFLSYLGEVWASFTPFISHSSTFSWHVRWFHSWIMLRSLYRGNNFRRIWKSITLFIIWSGLSQSWFLFVFGLAGEM